MTDFGARTYGDPCRECGFSWSMSASDAADLIEGIPARYASALESVAGDSRPPGTTWTVTAYVMHVADNFRIWAERLAGLALGDPKVVPYDQDELAAVRGYDGLSLVTAIWSLDRALGDWRAAWELAADAGALVLPHPEIGEQPLAGVIQLVAHDAHHHAWDLERARDAR